MSTADCQSLCRECDIWFAVACFAGVAGVVIGAVCL